MCVNKRRYLNEISRSSNKYNKSNFGLSDCRTVVYKSVTVQLVF